MNCLIDDILVSTSKLVLFNLKLCSLNWQRFGFNIQNLGFYVRIKFLEVWTASALHEKYASLKNCSSYIHVYPRVFSKTKFLIFTFTFISIGIPSCKVYILYFLYSYAKRLQVLQHIHEEMAFIRICRGIKGKNIGNVNIWIWKFVLTFVRVLLKGYGHDFGSKNLLGYLINYDSICFQ